MRKIISFKNILFFAVPLIFGFSFCNIVNAGSASFYLNQDTNTAEKTIEVSININSNTRINAAQSTISFNTSDLEVVSIDNNNSIFDLWVKSPTYSNSKGYIKFAGGSTRGFNGDGKLFTVKFKVKNKTTDKTDFKFTKSLILAANGKGTNVLAKLNKKEISLKSFKELSMK